MRARPSRRRSDAGSLALAAGIVLIVLVMLTSSSPASAASPIPVRKPPFLHATLIHHVSTGRRLCGSGVAAGNAYSNNSTGAAWVSACANATSLHPYDTVFADAGFKIPLRLHYGGTRNITADWTITWQLIGYNLGVELDVVTLNGSSVGSYGSVALQPSKYVNTSNQSITVTWNGTLLANTPYRILVSLDASAVSNFYFGTYASMAADGTLNRIQIT